jgi:Amidohydrolase
MGGNGDREIGGFTSLFTDPGAVTGDANLIPLPSVLIDLHCHVFNSTDLPIIRFIDRAYRKRYEHDADFLSLVVGLYRDITLGNAITATKELADINAGKGPHDKEDDKTESPSEFARMTRWIAKFNKSRRGLIAELSNIYATTGPKCVLMTPALVDFNTWLDSPDVPGCRLDDQVRVMGAIAKLPGDVRVHGFVGFDPVRAIFADADASDPNNGNEDDRFNVSQKFIDPFKLIDSAIADHGFLGVKIYPPMGFRATNNNTGEISFPPTLKRLSGYDDDRSFGNLLDVYLDKLYKKCAHDGIPILAHGYNSWGSGLDYAQRATPQFWKKVVEKHSTADKPLRLCLAHFGRFDADHVDSPCLDRDLFPGTWEVIFGNILQADKSKAAHVVADLSYFSEVLYDDLDNKTCSKRLGRLIRKFIDKYDKDVEHICYGSDWVLLAKEPNHRKYHVRLAQFLVSEVGLKPPELARVFFGNAVRFLGLRPGDQNYNRLKNFYHRNNIDNLFPNLEAMA